ncbi:gliding motility-associated C-terminal domain-containing protein [Flavobacterium sp.]|uniref:gliding motility-associated C-terminal domain-containing protein n=1 Tax=Flavobacterium sp. TaxID=239 RepID=UPI00260A193C|nr:gliding motility-associated C-terminal domain-containing protein [Flavobacterium sp.]MDD3004139.1 gliding motility-associated C-terminal domain-containing protein [Flavobacterium sp.]
MKFKLNNYLLLSLFFIVLFSSQKSFSQCIQIESILVAACSPATPQSEGYNEMVRFKVGATAINTSNMSVDWPANNWQGLIKNATTAAKVATLNAAIDAAGGCGNLIEPTAGVLPANATVILVTSYLMNTDSNTFGALAEDTYIIFQNNWNVTGGHFANYNSIPGLRTLEISFGASCIDIVTYERSNLVNQAGTSPTSDENGKGATVLFTPAGVPTYVNYGCSAPIPPFTVDAGLATMSACAGTTIALTGTALGQQSVSWSASSGTFSASSNLNTNYTIPNTAAGQTIVLTLTATNSCGATITDTINLSVTNSTIPTFSIANTLCAGSTAPILPTTSANGIVGTWSPSVVSNTADGIYVFTPDANQCATAFTLNVTVTNLITPLFSISNSLCTGATAPILPTTSTNGIVGTWSPSVVSNTADGTYVFTPNANQCAVPFTLNITVGATITPVFTIDNSICNGATAPVLPTTSSNGIVGVWSPAVVDNSSTANYVFTPNAGQCAVSFLITITVTDLILPTFTLENTICSGSNAPVLPVTSDNGISGTWNPSIVDNTNDGSYIFTPNNGQCADEFVLNVTITSFEVEKIQGCKNGEFIISVAPLNNSFDSNNVTYTWKNSANTVVGMNENQLNISQLMNAGTIQFPATYNVTISDNAGCSTNVDIVVQGAFCNIPKGISPNNDGDNDSFDLTGMGIKELFIYNRYGTEIYNKRNYTNEWNGQSNDGHELPSGTYFYVIYKNNNETNTGWVYITRG